MSEANKSGGFAPLPAPPSIRSVGIFGPTAIFTALAIGAGELMFWPGLMLSGGAGVLWLALLIVILQWVMNIEIARYSLATGQSMGEGIARQSRPLAFLLLLGAIIPWIWPGWVRSGGQLLAGLTGWSETILSLVSILICAALLSLPARAYPILERIQALMLGAIILGVIVLFAVLAHGIGGVSGFFGEFLAMKGAYSATAKFAAANGPDYYALLGGIVFAGAGGILNLGYGLLLADKGAGMGHYRHSIQGLGRPEVEDQSPIMVADTPDNRLNWRRWISVSRLEHLILFAGGNILSVIFVSAVFFMLYGGTAPKGSGVTLLVETFDLLSERAGHSMAILFALVGFLVFFTSAIGILHVTSRIASGIASHLFGGSQSKWFHRFVWLQFLASSVLILIDPRQPFWLLATSAVLNTVVMATYAYSIVWLNRRSLPAFAQAPKWAEAIVLVTGTLYGLVFVVTLTKLGG
jgi:hypothetical protein